MKRNCPMVVMAAAVLLAVGAVARAETAVKSFTKGEQLLANGDLDGALAAYANAARADRANQEYVQHYAMLRRIIQLHKSLDEEKEPARWESAARALHAFYVGEKVYGEALAIGRRIHARLNNEWSAVNLAETELALNLNEEAVKTLSGLEPDKSSPAASALLAVAAARSGQVDRAKKIADSLVLPEDAGSQTVYAAARLFAAVGDSATALKLLTRCLESTPPGLQDGFKAHAKSSPEFAAMAAAPEFAKAIDTPSKVPESKCSGGKSCAGCPMRGKCPSSQGK
jgi:tetratricopeptide (TPR) repeat protein